MALFIAKTYRDGKKHTTVLNYISAIAYQHKVTCHLVPTSSFLVHKLLLGVKNLTPPTSQLHPVTLDLLDHLQATTLVEPCEFNITLLQAMMSLMNFACLHVGEVAWSSHGDHILGI